MRVFESWKPGWGRPLDGLSLAFAAAAWLGAACGGTVQNAPLPQGKDWWFVGPGFKRITVTVTQSQSRHGYYIVTTTMTTTASGFTGIQMPEKTRTTTQTAPGNPELKEASPDIVTRPFKTLGELP
jgi:hypothetical protein